MAYRKQKNSLLYDLFVNHYQTQPIITAIPRRTPPPHPLSSIVGLFFFLNNLYTQHGAQNSQPGDQEAQAPQTEPSRRPWSGAFKSHIEHDQHVVL